MKFSFCAVAVLATLAAASPTPIEEDDDFTTLTYDIGGSSNGNGGHGGPPHWPGGNPPKPPKHPNHRPLVDSEKLRKAIKSKELLKKAEKLEKFAYKTTERNRYIGTPGHIATFEYLFKTFKKLDEFYTVALQPFNVTVGSSTFSVAGTTYPSATMAFAPDGDVTAPLVPIANFGCNAADYPASASGSIALISRGNCTFSIKNAAAKAAGAKGVVVYNDARTTETVVQGTLFEASPDYIPIIGASQATGLALVAAGGAPSARLVITSDKILTYNVHAQTLDGDQENVLHLGGHTDSVKAGPGINDNGSGTIGILETAIQLTKYSVKNAVRFSFWSGEEEGLVGSGAYVKSLTPEELSKIRLYLNFDMIASPNYIYGIYDGDGSAFNLTGPPGSVQAELLFEDYFKNIAKVPSAPTDFSGRSDYGPFLTAKVASGGLFTGAEVLKTPAQAALFGGTAGVAYDKNYHAVGDNVTNLNVPAFYENTKAIAHAVAVYGRSFDSLPPKNVTLKRRDGEPVVPTWAAPGACGGHIAELS